MLLLLLFVVQVNSIIELSGVDLAQLHGKEDVAYMSQVRVPCIKVIHIPAKPTTTLAEEGIDHSDVMEQVLSEVNAYNAQAYALLFDSKLPGAKISGGSGQVFDWSLVGGLQILFPISVDEKIMNLLTLCIS